MAGFFRGGRSTIRRGGRRATVGGKRKGRKVKGTKRKGTKRKGTKKRRGGSAPGWQPTKGERQ
jgi:hypothetical protein